MSRIGKLPITVPSGVDVTIDGQTVTVKGPKGQLSHVVAEPIAVNRDEDGAIAVSRPDDQRKSKELHGLSRTLIANLVTGVTDGYEKKLEIVGVGYRVLSKGPAHAGVLARLQPHHHGGGAGRHHLRGGGADPFSVQGIDKQSGRRGRRQHPQAAQARAVQGQGCAVRRRAGAPQGRKGW